MNLVASHGGDLTKEAAYRFIRDGVRSVLHRFSKRDMTVGTLINSFSHYLSAFFYSTRDDPDTPQGAKVDITGRCGHIQSMESSAASLIYLSKLLKHHPDQQEVQNLLDLEDIRFPKLINVLATPDGDYNMQIVNFPSVRGFFDDIIIAERLPDIIESRLQSAKDDPRMQMAGEIEDYLAELRLLMTLPAAEILKRHREGQPLQHQDLFSSRKMQEQQQQQQQARDLRVRRQSNIVAFNC